MSNFRIKLIPGLLNDFNSSFNLNLEHLNKFGIKVYLGDKYVESETPQITSALEDTFTYYEGVLPKDSNDWGNTYSEEFQTLLMDYFKGPSSSSVFPTDSHSVELYESSTSYESWTNLFQSYIEGSSAVESGNDRYDSKYIAYDRTAKELKNRQYKEFSVDEPIDLNIYLIHLSKYYNIYSLKTGLPILRPLVYDLEDLYDYNISYNDGKFFINNFLMLLMQDGHTQAYKYEASNLGTFSTEGVNGIWYDCDTGKRNISQFAENVHGLPTMNTNESSEHNWHEYVPTGFTLIGVPNYASSLDGGFGNNNEGGGEDGKSPALVKASAINYRWSANYNAKSWTDLTVVGGSGDGALLQVAYKVSKDDDLHFMNLFFMVNKDEQNRIVYQQEYNQVANGGATIASSLISALAHIYLYKNDVNTNYVTISNVIYLTQHNTYYTQDIIYDIYYKGTDDLAVKNDSILLNKYSYKEYLDAVMGHLSNEEKSLVSRNNVDVNFTRNLKNIPMLLRIPYVQQEYDESGRTALVYRVHGDPVVVSHTEITKDILYYLRDNSLIQMDAMFEYHPYTSITIEDGYIKGVEDVNVLSNQWLNQGFIAQDDKLYPKQHRASGSSSSQFSIYYPTSEDAAGMISGAFPRWTTLKDLVKNEVLVPYAKLV